LSKKTSVLLSVFFVWVAVLCVVTAQDLRAEDAPSPGWFIPVGVNLGLALTLPDADPSFIAGAEASAAYLFNSTWAGFYLDALYDTEPTTTPAAVRASAGVEAGWFILGAEAGYVASFHPNTDLDPAHGLRLGALLSGGLGSGYTRWSFFPSPAGVDPVHILEIGVLIKWPFMVSGE
jgi:hypothetical protein